MDSTDAKERQKPNLAELKERVCAFLDAVSERSEEDVKREFGHVHERARELVQRKLAMTGSKSETRDLLGELVFSRLRGGLRNFLRAEDGSDDLKAAEWVMGSLLSMSAISEFSVAIDRAILEMSAPREYSFAGMADFISIEEVMQLLGSGRHVGCLSLEKPDNRIDIYLNTGRIAFLDPHRMIRRMLPGAGSMDYREISEEVLRKSEAEQRETGTPLLLALEKAGVFHELDIRNVISELGSEVFHEFLLDPDAVFFSYRRLPELPEFAQEHDLRFGVTGLLLEGNKKLDDWRSMCRIFPDKHEPITPVDDMYAKIGDLNLGVTEIKLLAHINGENDAQQISEAMGLPLFETYQHLVRLARAGAVSAPGNDALPEVSMSVEESMKLAFEALDANDDSLAVSSALDRVLGGGDSDGLFGDVSDEEPAEEEDDDMSLGFLGKRN
ncbi:MAG: DUF4388 domain-containing protein [Planctomycetes bacterium]|nr:DUF4388 domain-containing protein [Planctomycetota bacterium]